MNTKAKPKTRKARAPKRDAQLFQAIEDLERLDRARKALGRKLDKARDSHSCPIFNAVEAAFSLIMQRHLQGGLGRNNQDTPELAAARLLRDLERTHFFERLHSDTDYGQMSDDYDDACTVRDKAYDNLLATPALTEAGAIAKALTICRDNGESDIPRSEAKHLEADFRRIARRAAA